jgi:hypothetical protein
MVRLATLILTPNAKVHQPVLISRSLNSTQNTLPAALNSRLTAKHAYRIFRILVFAQQNPVSKSPRLPANLQL